MSLGPSDSTVKQVLQIESGCDHAGTGIDKWSYYSSKG